MKIVDANVLLYAVNEASPQHQSARRWIDSQLNGTELIGFPWVVLLAFLRLSTNPRAFVKPLTTDQAANTLAAWLARPAALIVEPTEHHLNVLAALLHTAGTGGNLVTDAHIAALGIEHDAEVVSFDSDFRRFTGVRWASPEQDSQKDGATTETRDQA